MHSSSFTLTSTLKDNFREVGFSVIEGQLVSEKSISEEMR